jgi:hypothetical protein
MVWLLLLLLCRDQLLPASKGVRLSGLVPGVLHHRWVDTGLWLWHMRAVSCHCEDKLHRQI